jgi:hypothetical protein
MYNEPVFWRGEPLKRHKYLRVQGTFRYLQPPTRRMSSPWVWGLFGGASACEPDTQHQQQPAARTFPTSVIKQANHSLLERARLLQVATAGYSNAMS